MLRLSFLLFSFLIVAFSAAGQEDTSAFQRTQFVFKGDTLPYRILLPRNFNPKKQYPLVLFLHGSGERGSDNRKQLTHGASLFLADSNRTRFPAIIVFPQCHKPGYWSNVYIENDTAKGKKRIFHYKPDSLPTRDMALLMELVRWLPTQYKISSRKTYVMGLSMGGMGTLEIVRRMPGHFKSAIAICGGAHPATAPKIRKQKLWLLHGLKDDVVPPEKSILFYLAMKRENAPIWLTLFPEANHNAWDPSFKTPDLLPWLFGIIKKPSKHE